MRALAARDEGVAGRRHGLGIPGHLQYGKYSFLEALLIIALLIGLVVVGLFTLYTRTLLLVQAGYSAKVYGTSNEIFETSLQAQLAGAPYFMAPELLRGERHTVASDV